jgi:hypothetical protein
MFTLLEFSLSYLFCYVLFSFISFTLYFQPDRWEKTEFSIHELQDVFACVEAFKF